MVHQRFRNTWLTAVGGAALLALGTVGCGAYEPEPEYPQYEYAPPPPARAPSDDLLAQNMGNMGPNVPGGAEMGPGGGAGAPMGQGPEVAIGEGQTDEYSDTDPSALNEFKPALEGHGQWVDDATYGTVWVPSQAEVGTDFQPYSTAGHWTYDDSQDYVWVSDYSWGWAPFHYGRWANVGPYGWSWIPGRQYSGAWVSWRVGPAGYGYVGWGPMAPDWYWYHGTAVGWSFGYYHPYDHYVYCDRGHLYDHGIGRYAVGGPAARQYYEHTVAYAPPARVAANPSVAGNGRVAAQPTVGGRRGPSPNEMGIGRDAVASPPATNQGLNQARAMSTPSSAVAHGAQAPFRTASTNSGQSTGGFAAGSRGPASTAMTNGAGSPAFRQNGNAQAGSAFASRSTPITRNPTAPSNSAPAFRPSTSTYTPGRVYSPSASASAPRASAPAFRSSQSYAPSYSRSSSPSSFSHASAPSMHSSSSGSSSAPHSSGRSGGGGGGGGHSGGHRR